MNLNDTNRDLTNGPAADKMDQLLAAHFASDQELAPSSGFALSVMESLHAEAEAPPPIPFPWRRVVPSLIALLCGAVGFGIFVRRTLHTFTADTGAQPEGSAILQASLPIHLTSLEQGLCWIAMATCLSIAIAVACMRLTSSGKMRV